MIIAVKSILFLFSVFAVSFSSEEYEYGSDVEPYIVACHSTDFKCFQTQFQYLRDIVLLGSEELDVSVYQHYQFHNSDTNTCVRITGEEASQLVGISFDGLNKVLKLTVAMPVRLQQVEYNSICQVPEREFDPVGTQEGPYKKFTCNATMVLQYPFRLYKEENQTYMTIEEKDMDVVLDIPDFSTYNRESKLETRLFQLSEWAFQVVQHAAVPDHVMVPFMQTYRTILTRLPIHKLILLYPREHYADLVFDYTDVSKLKHYYTEQ